MGRRRFGCGPNCSNRADAVSNDRAVADHVNRLTGAARVPVTRICGYQQVPVLEIRVCDVSHRPSRAPSDWMAKPHVSRAIHSKTVRPKARPGARPCRSDSESVPGTATTPCSPSDGGEKPLKPSSAACGAAEPSESVRRRPGRNRGLRRRGSPSRRRP